LGEGILAVISCKNGALIHEKAHVEGAQIGARTKVWQFASVIRNARIGEDCSIATGAIVDGARLGARVIVSHGAFIDPGIVIGNDVFIGPHVDLCNDAWPRVEKTGFDIAALISGDLVTTRIEDGASLGAGVIVLPGIIIGAGAMVAAGSVVECSVPPAHLHKRNGMVVPIDPSRIVKRMRSAA
jgi:UDP-2-acetamido-3-amino-2,3-dideoxy-glucuronate N-acetyltransferase